MITCVGIFFFHSIISDEVLLKILDLPILVVLDEAYIEFSGIESKMQWVKKHENLIVLRTFSKRAGMYKVCSNIKELVCVIIECIIRILIFYLNWNYAQSCLTNLKKELKRYVCLSCVVISVNMIVCHNHNSCPGVEAKLFCSQRRFSETSLLQFYVSIDIANFMLGKSYIATWFWVELNPTPKASLIYGCHHSLHTS